MCGKHKSQDTITEALPCGRMTNIGMCMRPREVGGTVCTHHRMNDEYYAERARVQAIWRRAMDILWETSDPDAARAVLTDAAIRNEIRQETFNEQMNRLEDQIAYFTAAHGNPVPQLAVPPHVVAVEPDLAALSRDAQNVHTRAVNTQTNEGLEMLTSTVVPTEIDTPAELAEVWAHKHRRSLESVLTDVRKWYTTSDCRQAGDHLYRKALDGLWVRIKASPYRTELTQRLWEECAESRNMCCGGHLARLCNVMCGFDDGFKAALPVGELLQERIAAIAKKEMDVHLKVGEAWLVFEELAIPMPERIPWLEAL